MRIERLSLTDFRNHADLVLAAAPGFNILYGENGSGKTNVLEALSLLAPGRGLRRARLSAMARHNGSGGFAVAVRGEAVEIGTGTTPSAPERRLVKINGAAAAANSLADYLSLLWLTPAMDRLFIETAGGRRRFLDRLVLALHPAHALHATRYEAAMRARNRLLARDAMPDRAWLAGLEAQMAEHATAIEEARRTTVSALDATMAAAPEGVFARAGITLQEVSVSDLAGALAQGRSRDAAAGRALTGPHRADLKVVNLSKRQAAEHSSTGEQKALLLGIILAHAELVSAHTGHPPILLLDEVAAHLDPQRRTALYERLAAYGGQVWLTGTEASLFADVPADAARIGLGGN